MGVSHGSIVCLLLFLTYINVQPGAFALLNSILLADDIGLVYRKTQDELFVVFAK